jgi:hypothetical protein
MQLVSLSAGAPTPAAFLLSLYYITSFDRPAIRKPVLFCGWCILFHTCPCNALTAPYSALIEFLYLPYLVSLKPSVIVLCVFLCSTAGGYPAAYIPRKIPRPISILNLCRGSSDNSRLFRLFSRLHRLFFLS